MESLKGKIDTININFKIDEDLSVIHKKSKYNMIEIYPRLQHIFNVLGIPEEKFRLHNNSVASRYKLNYEGIYLELKSMPPRPSEKIDHSKRICLLQLKGEFFLNNDFEQFTEIFNKLKPDSVSKVEVAFDFIEENHFLKDCMNIFLNNRSQITNLEGDNKIYLNFNSTEEFGLSYSNISKELKVYQKSIQLQSNKMRDLFYIKNPEFINKTHFRIELGLSRSVNISRHLNVNDLLKTEKSENEFIKVFVRTFFKNFDIKKKSKLRDVIKAIKGKF